MQMCGDCYKVYDESENAKCPKCKNKDKSIFAKNDDEDED